MLSFAEHGTQTSHVIVVLACDILLDLPQGGHDNQAARSPGTRIPVRHPSSRKCEKIVDCVNSRQGDMKRVIRGSNGQRTRTYQPLGELDDLIRRSQQWNTLQMCHSASCRLPIATAGFLKDQGRGPQIEVLALTGPPPRSHLLPRRYQRVRRWARGQVTDDRCLDVERSHWRRINSADYRWAGAGEAGARRPVAIRQAALRGCQDLRPDSVPSRLMRCSRGRVRPVVEVLHGVRNPSTNHPP